MCTIECMWAKEHCAWESCREDHCLGMRPASFIGVPGNEDMRKPGHEAM